LLLEVEFLAAGAVAAIALDAVMEIEMRCETVPH
jgi:hypothetical protein